MCELGDHGCEPKNVKSLLNCPRILLRVLRLLDLLKRISGSVIDLKIEPNGDK